MLAESSSDISVFVALGAGMHSLYRAGMHLLFLRAGMHLMFPCWDARVVFVPKRICGCFCAGMHLLFWSR